MLGGRNRLFSRNESVHGGSCGGSIRWELRWVYKVLSGHNMLFIRNESVHGGRCGGSIRCSVVIKGCFGES